MKVSVVTYRASTERLNNLRLVTYGTLRRAPYDQQNDQPKDQQKDQQPRRGVSLESAALLLGSVGKNLGLGSEDIKSFVAPRSATAIGLSGDYETPFRERGTSGESGAESLPWNSGRGRIGSGTSGVEPSTSSKVNNYRSGYCPGVMMVDGSPRRIAAPDQNNSSNNNSNNNNSSNSNNNATSPQGPEDKNNGNSGDANSSSNSAMQANALGTVLLIPGVGNYPTDTKGSEGATSGGAPSNSSAGNQGEANRSSRSRWLKLRTTVQLSGAITQVHKKPPLKREDSFLKRFSTRHITDPCSIDGSSRRGENSKGNFFGSWRSVVNPDENILFYWLSLLTACLLYNAWTIIVRQAFPELQDRMAAIWYTADAFSDVVFLLDIAFQFRTGYLEQGLMVYESRKLARHYFRSRPFLMDIVAVTPLDLLQFRVGVLPLLRFPRFLKVYRSFRFYYMVESRTIYPNLWRVVNLIHILLLLAHWFGCFYYMLSELEDFVGDWAYRRPVGEYATLARKYLGSVYWSTLTLTTIGDLATPATNLQYLFTIVSYLIGVFIFATIVGQVGNVITNRNASRLEFERLLDGAKLYMRHHKVPRNMQRRVQRWYDYSWSRGRMQGGGDINSALGILPDKLKTELALHVNLKTLKKVSIFQECQPEFLHDLVLKMKAYIFTPGDLICRKGEVAREMFIIADGVLEVISESGKVLTQMKAGDFFGEIGILNLDGFNRRTADVRSVGYSELFSLSREDILAAMKDYPEAQEILQTMGRKRLMEARLAANMSKNPKEETPVTSNKRGVAAVTVDLSKRVLGAQRPRTAVSKFKCDVRNFKKLLRSRSTPTGKTCLATSAEEQVEMKPIQRRRETDKSLPDDSRNSPRRRKPSLSNLMRKINFKGDSESSSPKKGITGRLSNMRSQLRNSEMMTSRDSSSSQPLSVDSTEGNTPINKALPLLQRIRLLGEQERNVGSSTSVVEAPTTNITANSIKPLPTGISTEPDPPHEVIGEGLPLLERLKLLRVKEQQHQQQSQGALSSSSGKEASQPIAAVSKTRQSSCSGLKEIAKPTTSQYSVPKKAASLTSRLVSVIGSKPSTQLPGGSLAATSTSRSSEVPLKARSTEMPSELPLLKKVLLMKIMEDKKAAADASSADVPNEGQNATEVSTSSTLNFPQISSRPKEGGGLFRTTNSSVPTPRTAKQHDNSDDIKPKRTTVAVKSLGDARQEDESQRKTATTSPTDCKTNRQICQVVVSSRDSGRHTGDLSSDQTETKSRPLVEKKTSPVSETAPDAKIGGSGTSSSANAVSPNGSRGNQSHLPHENSTATNNSSVSGETVSLSVDNETADDPTPPKARVRKDSTTAELLSSKTKEGYTARKGKLSRMMALREDSDEHGSASSSDENDDLDESSDDPFVKNIECQTEVHPSTSTSPDTWSPKQSTEKYDFGEAGGHKKNRRSSTLTKSSSSEKFKTRLEGMEVNDDVIYSEDGIQDYLVKVMKHVKHILKSYVVEQQQELQNRVIALEKELREKDALIRHLKASIYSQRRGSTVTRTSSTFDEVSSFDLSSLSSSESEDEPNAVTKAEKYPKRNVVSTSAMDDGNDCDDDMLDQEDEMLLKMHQSRPQRKSWTYGGCDGDLSKLKARRKQLLSTRQSYSLDDEKSQVAIAGYRADELWKLEFPVGESPQIAVEKRLVQDVPEEEEEDDEEEEEEEAEYDRRQQVEAEKYSHIIVNAMQQQAAETAAITTDEEPPIEEIENANNENLHLEDEFEISPSNVSVAGGNDWEVQMLVHQFEKNIRQKRRHSSGEVLSWQAVLGSRALAAVSPTNTRGAADSISTYRDKKGRRKLSLVEDRLPPQWSNPPVQKSKYRSMIHLAANSTKHAVLATCSKTKLSPGEASDSSSSMTSATVGAKSHGPSGSETKTNPRRRPHRYRRQNSFGELKPSQHPRKSSLPTADSLNNICLSRLVGADSGSTNFAKHAGKPYYQQTATAPRDVDPKFGSLEDVSRMSSTRKHPWPRSPSSPNFPTDHNFWGSDLPVPEQHIPEWPSSPCLPTITEDDHSLGASATSSPCRSFSHDCLPTLPQCTFRQEQSSDSPSWTSSWTASRAEPRFVFPDVRQLGGDGQHKVPPSSAKSSADIRASRLKGLRDEDDGTFLPFAQSREDSVVIAIPESEPLLSPR